MPKRRKVGSRILKWQRALKAHGFNPGSIDGAMGPNTIKAITECKDWQMWLHSRGFYFGPADGWPGAITEAAIRKFQRAAGISVDGIVGPQTRNARKHWPNRIQRITRPIVDRVINPIVNRIYGATKWPDFVLHYSVSNYGDAKTINSWHRARGFKKGGYPVVCKRDGTIETGDQFPQYLRRHDEVGAHIKGRNHRSYGLCFISIDGNITPEQFENGYKFIAQMRSHGCGYERIDGHRFFPGQATSCPGVLDIQGLKQKAGV